MFYNPLIGRQFIPNGAGLSIVTSGEKSTTSQYACLTPALGAVLFDFDYKLDGTGGRSVARAFTHGAPHVGLQTVWNPKGPFSLAAGILSSLPFSTLPLILSVDLTGKYQLWGQANRGGSLFLGIGYDRIDFEDSQTVPNHIEVDMGPLLIVGLKVRF